MKFIAPVTALAATFFCANADVSGLQDAANNFCLSTYGSPYEIARRDVGTIEQQNAIWRCYRESELNGELMGTNNCVDDCNNLINCLGKVEGVSYFHTSRDLEITTFLSNNEDTYCTQAPTAEPTAEPTTAEPTAEPTAAPTTLEPTAEPTAYPTYEEGTPQRVSQVAAANVGLRCNDITINIDHFWQNVDNKSYVDLPDDGVFKFSVMGGADAGVNVALTDKDATEFAGVDVFIGSDTEAVIHISEDLDSMPKAFADIANDKIFQGDSFTKVWIKVAGDNISIGKGVYSDESNALLSYTLSTPKVMNKAVFSYGYGDYECETL